MILDLRKEYCDFVYKYRLIRFIGNYFIVYIFEVYMGNNIFDINGFFLRYRVKGFFLWNYI